MASDILVVYIVDPKTNHYKEYSITDTYKKFDFAKEGNDFFDKSQFDAEKYIFDEDLDRFYQLFTKENVRKSDKTRFSDCVIVCSLMVFPNISV